MNLPSLNLKRMLYSFKSLTIIPKFKTSIAKTLPISPQRRFFSNELLSNFYFTKNHDFFKVEEDKENMATICIGVTKTGLERIGNIQEIKVTQLNEITKPNDEICGLIWSAFKSNKS
jgi:hypothetical protein